MDQIPRIYCDMCVCSGQILVGGSVRNVLTPYLSMKALKSKHCNEAVVFCLEMIYSFFYLVIDC